MRILFLDTSTSVVTIAVIEDDNVLFMYHDEIIDDMSSKIMPIISSGFEKIKFSINDIDKVMVANGPGSFTGIRIGVTIAKVIAWSLKKEIICVSSLELYASTNVDTKYIIPMIDARRGFVYTGIYDNDLNVVFDDNYALYSDFISSIDEEYTIVSFDNIDGAIKPNINLIKLVNKHRNDKSLIVHNVKPRYLKKTEAEEKLERKND